MGRHRDARDAFDQLLEEHEDLDPDVRTRATERRHEEAGRVAQILLRGLEDAPDAQVHLDGLEVALAAGDPAELETDPGRHAVRVELEGFHSWREELTLEDGERARLTVELEAIETPVIVMPEDPEPGSDASEAPLLWTGVGILVAGIAAALSVILYFDAQLSPDPGFSPWVVEL